jgi:hypothetical protein
LNNNSPSAQSIKPFPSVDIQLVFALLFKNLLFARHPRLLGFLLFMQRALKEFHHGRHTGARRVKPGMIPPGAANDF